MDSISANVGAPCVICLPALQLNGLNALGDRHVLHLSLVILDRLRLIQFRVLSCGLLQDIRRSLARLGLSERFAINRNIKASICDKIPLLRTTQSLLSLDCVLETSRSRVDISHAIMRILLFMLSVPLEKFVCRMIKNCLIARPSFCDKLLHDVFVGVQDARRSEKLRRLQLQLVRL